MQFLKNFKLSTNPEVKRPNGKELRTTALKTGKLSQPDVHYWPDAGAADQSTSSAGNEFMSSQTDVLAEGLEGQ